MTDIETTASRTRFGAEMRQKHFSFEPGYRPLNHGSFGTFPKSVQAHRRHLQSLCEAAPDTFIRFTYPKLLSESKAAIAPLLGADAGEVALVSNATTAVNVVLRSLVFGEDDVILYFDTIYGACLKTIQSVLEIYPATTAREIGITYPTSEGQIVRAFEAAVREVRDKGKKPRLAMFDTVLSFPGVRFPWEQLVKVCKRDGILSLIDGAHGVGHIDLTHVSTVGPDFFLSNCHKWLMVPRGCCVLYVPFRNQALITTSIPTSWGYLTPSEREDAGARAYFGQLFDFVGTADTTPYCCIPAAIRDYCFRLAGSGGKKMAEILGTEALENTGCCFATVRLPVTPAELGIGGGDEEEEGLAVAAWMQERSGEYGTYLLTELYNGAFWCRVSAQVYLEIADFGWAAARLGEISERAKAGEWKQKSASVVDIGS